MKAGDTLKTRTGDEVEILKVSDQAFEGGYYIVGLRKNSDDKSLEICTWTREGKYHDSGRESVSDLVLPQPDQRWSTVIGYEISVFQVGDSETFTVKYGSQVTTDLTYREAAKDIGYCVMHALAAEGRIFTAEDTNDRVQRDR